MDDHTKLCVNSLRAFWYVLGGGGEEKRGSGDDSFVFKDSLKCSISNFGLEMCFDRGEVGIER